MYAGVINYKMLTGNTFCVSLTDKSQKNSESNNVQFVLLLLDVVDIVSFGPSYNTSCRKSKQDAMTYKKS